MDQNQKQPSLGEMLKRFRERQGITQNQLGERMYVHRNTVGRWEQGGPIEREAILQLKSALRLTEFETDMLLYLATYGLKYGTPISEITQALENDGHAPDPSDGRLYGYLRVKRGEEIVRSYPLRRDVVLIGRHPMDCDIVVAEEFSQTSRHHARVIRGEDGVYIEDAGSKRGTFLDGNRVVEPTLLRPGQSILLGARLPRAQVCELEFALEPVPTD